MIKKITLRSLLLLLLTGCVSINSAKHNSYELPDNAYLDGRGSKTAVILCHGRGHHPTWDVVDPLRIGIHKSLGYHTLSIQMPTTSGGLENYLPLFNDAYKRIQSSIDYLVKEKGITRIFLMGHSMGARMSSAFIVQDKKKQVAGYIGVGVVGGGDGPLDANSNLISISDYLPIIDVVAGGEEKDRFDAEYRKLLISSKLKTYKQVYITGAGHRFSGYEDEMVAKVVSWLQERKND